MKHLIPPQIALLAPMTHLPASGETGEDLALILPPTGPATVPAPFRDYHYITSHLINADVAELGEGVYSGEPIAWERSEDTLSASFSLIGGQDLVLITSGGITPGTELTSLTLNLNEVSGIIPLYSLHFALMDEKGSILATHTEQFEWFGQQTITLDRFGANEDNSIIWSEGYRLIVGLVKDDVFGTGYHTNFSGLSLSATQIIPEPTAATLSLLALAGLAARRRRK